MSVLMSCDVLKGVTYIFLQLSVFLKIQGEEIEVIISELLHCSMLTALFFIIASALLGSQKKYARCPQHYFYKLANIVFIVLSSSQHGTGVPSSTYLYLETNSVM